VPHLSETVDAWFPWLPPDYGRIWVLEAQRGGVLATAARLPDLAQKHVILTVSENVAVPLAAFPRIEVRRQAPEFVVSQTQAHDLILWPAGSRPEEEEWAEVYRALEAKGCYVLHWVVSDEAVLTLYQGYLWRRVDGVADTFVLDWDPDLYR
jgi:hypothetical protein